MNLLETIRALIERAGKPGVMSLAGRASERKMATALGRYFRVVGTILQVRLRRLGNSTETKEIVRHTAEMIAMDVVRRQSHTLFAIVSSHVMEAMLKADKQSAFHEAKVDASKDVLGLSGKEAADYAAEEAAKRVGGINEETVARYADAVAMAIEDKLGVAGLSKLLRGLTEDMSKARADIIARTEIGDAFGEAAMKKLIREEIEYKQLIPSPDACEICMSIVEAGPVPVNEPFVDDDDDEYDRSPIHVSCRCATVGSRAPIGEE